MKHLSTTSPWNIFKMKNIESHYIKACIFLFQSMTLNTQNVQSSLIWMTHKHFFLIKIDYCFIIYFL